MIFEEMTGQANVDVVYGVQIKRKGSWFEKLSGKLFYKLISVLSSVKYPANTLTARVMSRKYVDSILRFKEKELDLWSVLLSRINQLAYQSTKVTKELNLHIQEKIKTSL